MMKRFVWSFLAIGLISVAAPSASADIITICSSDFMLDWPDCDCGDKLPQKFPLAIFDYKNQQALKSISGIHLTLTVQDGETAVGQLDHNNWSLGLGSVNTGLKLNGFEKGQISTVTFDWNAASGDWPSQQKLAQVLNEIKTNNGLITGSIIDSTPDDNVVQFYSAYQVELCLTGESVPEPASILVWTALAGCGAIVRRRVANRLDRPVAAG